MFLTRFYGRHAINLITQIPICLPKKQHRNQFT